MIDINAKLGHWPYRPVPGLDDLLRAMDSLGIERACVSSLDAVFYLNPQDGNDELVTWVQPHRNRLIPLAVIKPTFRAWREDLRRCFEEYGMRGVVLYPNYHRYELTSSSLHDLMETSIARSVPVFLQAGLEDIRRQYDRERISEVPAAQIGQVARAFPAAKVIALGLKIGQPEQMGQPLPDNLFFDTSNYEKMGELEFAVEHFGPGRIFFGTNFPLFNARANTDKLRLANLDETARGKIGKENARHLLGL
ncbi:MAG: amidohydrolase family protein [Candidatus Hydrogenedentes bacterium]|nr:amidohydrolase family protein [Candidatus Hydrogenedentota bacterium]